MSDSKRNDNQPDSPHPATPAEVQSLLSEFEQSVDALRKLCSGKPASPRSSDSDAAKSREAAHREEEAIEQRARMEQGQRELSTLHEQIERVRSEFQQHAAALEANRQAAMREAEVQRTRIEEDLAGAAEKLRLATEQESAATARLAELQANAAHLEEERSRVLKLATEVAAEKARLESWNAEIVGRLNDLQGREQACQAASAGNLAEVNAQLADARSLAEHKSAELADFRRRTEAAETRVIELEEQLKQANVGAPSALWHADEMRSRQRLEEMLDEVRRDLDAAKADAQTSHARAVELQAALEDARRQANRGDDLMRGLHDENDQLRTQLEAMKFAVDALEKKAAVIASEQNERARRLADAERTVAELKRELAGRPDAATLSRQLREEIEADVQAPLAALSARAEQAEAAMESLRVEADGLKARVAQGAGQLAALESRLSEAAQTLADRDARLVAQAHERETLAGALRDSQDKLCAEAAQFQEAQRGLIVAQSQQQEAGERLAALERSLAEARELSANFEAQARNVMQQLESARAESVASQERVAELRRQIGESGSRSEAAVAATAALEAELAQARNVIDTLTAQLNEARQTIDGQAARFETERVGLQMSLGESASEREQIEQALAACRSEIQRRDQQIAELTHACEEAKSSAARSGQVADENARLAIRLREAMSVAEVAASRLRELETAAEINTAELVDLRARLDTALQSAQIDESGLHAKLEMLKGRLRAEIDARDADHSRIATLEAQLAAHADGGSLPPARRERLRAYRRLRRDQSAKLRNLGEALRSRFDICEQVLAQRQQLASAAQLVAEARRKYEAKQASSRMAVVGAFASITLLILASLSWAAAGQLFPGRHAARVTIEADGRGRDLPDVELKEWQAFHESLLKSPEFVEQAADHMRKFGLLETAGSVAARFKEDLAFESERPGKLVIELHGEGAARTARELTAISTRFVAEAQESRSRRTDAAITTITKPAAAIDGAIDNQRLMGAGGLFAGSVMVVAGILFIAYRRLASAKSKFENQIAIEGILDESRWPNPAEGAEMKKAA